MQTVIPAKSQLFCKPNEKQTKTPSGFILADTAAEKPSTAEVINAGESTPYKSKDIIIYKSYATTDIKLNGEEYFLIAEEDVLGTVIEVDG